MSYYKDKILRKAENKGKVHGHLYAIILKYFLPYEIDNTIDYKDTSLFRAAVKGHDDLIEFYLAIYHINAFCYSKSSVLQKKSTTFDKLNQSLTLTLTYRQWYRLLGNYNPKLQNYNPKFKILSLDDYDDIVANSTNDEVIRILSKNCYSIHQSISIVEKMRDRHQYHRNCVLERIIAELKRRITSARASLKAKEKKLLLKLNVEDLYDSTYHDETEFSHEDINFFDNENAYSEDKSDEGEETNYQVKEINQMKEKIDNVQNNYEEEEEPMTKQTSLEDNESVDGVADFDELFDSAYRAMGFADSNDDKILKDSFDDARMITEQGAKENSEESKVPFSMSDDEWNMIPSIQNK